MSRYLVTIGLEVHCQVNTRTKMFCGCEVAFGSPVNALTCPVCLGLPGALPVLNRVAIGKTILAGLMLGSRIPEVSHWDRKNYFYPDMPKNYQISQLHSPLCIGGEVILNDLHYPKDAQKDIRRPGVAIRLDHIHLEEDVAKSTHYENNSLIDFNRAGTPLMEIVSEPDIESPEEAVAYLNALRQILIYGGISDADMEKGQMRCDVNISLRPPGQQELGEKVELKNLNSMSAIRRALHYEIARQSEELGSSIAQVQSTRRWDDTTGETQLMRTKEYAHDYRYFPDPDLLPIHTEALVAKVRSEVPELPAAKRARFVEQYEVTDYDAGVLASERSLADYFENAAKGHAAPKKIANWVINEWLALLNQLQLSVDRCPVRPTQIGELVDLVEGGKISSNQGVEVLAGLFENPDSSPAKLASKMGFEQVSDSNAIDELVRQAIDANPDKVADVQAGNMKTLNWLTGQVMKASKGKANPRMVSESLKRLLDV